MAEERSVSGVLQDILRNLQEMVHSEIHLAKVEMREEAKQAAWSSVWIAAGVAGVLSGWIFLLWAAVYGLATQMPMWAATIVVAVVIGGAGAALLSGGIRKVKRVHPIPERTVESVKENLEWIKQPTK